MANGNGGPLDNKTGQWATLCSVALALMFGMLEFFRQTVAVDIRPRDVYTISMENKAALSDIRDDVKELKANQAALKESLNRLSRAIEKLDDTITEQKSRPPLPR